MKAANWASTISSVEVSSVSAPENLRGKFNFSRFLEDMTSGSQSSTQFFNRVPENHHTDFIFSVLAENFGLIGGVTLLLLYGYLLFRMIRVARKTEEDDIFGKCIAVGVFSSFLFSILQNIGMTMGIMPISGITHCLLYPMEEVPC